MTVDEFIEVLRLERIRRRVEHRWVAEQLGVAAPHLSGYESGRHQPGRKVIEAWARALDVPVPGQLRDSNLADFVQRLRLERYRRRIEQTELAAAIGVFPLSIKKWETGQRTPTDENLRAWAAYLRVPVPPGVHGDPRADPGRPNGGRA